MKHKKHVVNKLIHIMELEPDILPGLPVIELFGNQRLIIENYLRVTDYSAEQIYIALSFGHLQIYGSNLLLARLAQDKLVVTGRIQKLSLNDERGC